MSSQSPDASSHDSIVEVELTLQNSTYPVVKIAEELECHISVLEAVPATTESDRLVEFLEVHDGRDEQIVTIAEDCDWTTEIDIINTQDDTTLVSLEVANCVAQSISNTKSIFAAAEVVDGEARIRFYIPPNEQKTEILNTIKEKHPTVETASICTQPPTTKFLTQQSFQQMLRERLTERQWNTLRLAYAGGYFKRPREIAQDDIADAMDLSQETISQHLRAAQRQLLSIVFDQEFIN